MGDVTIIRAPRGKEHPYFVHRRATAQDRALSFEARGVVAYLLSKPDDWSITLNDLMAEGGIGRDKARRILNELADAGYLKQEQPHGEGGKFGTVVYVLHEEPQPVTEKPSAVEPVTEKPSTVQPLAVQPSTANPHHTYKEILQSTESLQRTESTEIPSSSVVESPAREPVGADAPSDDDETFTLWVKGFNLFSDTRQILLALPRPEAVGLMLEAKRQAHDGDGSGLLAQMLRTGTGRTADALRLAPIALETGTLDWAECDRALRIQDQELLTEQVRGWLGVKVDGAPQGGEREPDGLDQILVDGERGGLTVRQVWQAAKGQLSVQLNQSTYTAWVAGVTATRYAEGVLTLRAPHGPARDFLDTRMRGVVEQAVRVIAEQAELRIEVVA